jgi:hypothetical protein
MYICVMDLLCGLWVWERWRAEALDGYFIGKVPQYRFLFQRECRFVFPFFYFFALVLFDWQRGGHR